MNFRTSFLKYLAINLGRTLLFAALGMVVYSCREPAKLVPNGVYAAAPSNTIKLALDTMFAALQRRDSAAYWNSLCYESREWSDVRKPAKALWDNAEGSKVTYDLHNAYDFIHTVHSPNDIARFGHAWIDLQFQGKKSVRYDSLLVILRADTGRWFAGTPERLTSKGDLKEINY